MPTLRLAPSIVNAPTEHAAELLPPGPSSAVLEAVAKGRRLEADVRELCADADAYVGGLARREHVTARAAARLFAAGVRAALEITRARELRAALARDGGVATDDAASGKRCFERPCL